MKGESKFMRRRNISIIGCYTEKRFVEREQNQSQEDNETADDVTIGERCAIPREIYNDIAVVVCLSKFLSFRFTTSM
jgi:hypothetical protein